MLRQLMIVVLVSALLSSRTYGEQDSASDDNLEMLPPVLVGVDEHGHILPSLGGSTEKPLLGRPDGHDLSGRDGTSQPVTEKPLIGQPDGHDTGRDDLIGRPDGHDGMREDLIGRPDGHDTWKEDPNEPQGEQEEVAEELGVDYGDEPLVRCKRPLCRMACEFGFQTDSTGCPICKCLEDPCQGVQCTDGTVCLPVFCEETRSCVELSHRCQPNVQCPMPMCATDCPDGYANDANGCMTCTCIGDTPPQPSDIADELSGCPEPMCATFCQNGYKKDSRGCMTCDCNEEEPDSIQCGMHKCTVGQVCRSAAGYIEYGTADSSAVCTPKPLCHIAQDMAFMKRDQRRRLPERNLTRMFVPECDDEGNFKPKQCNYLVSECWCVDDRGKELEGTRTSILDETISLQCSPRLTNAVLIEMILTPSDGEDNGDEEVDDNDEDDDDDDDDDDFPKAAELHYILQHAVSSWLLMEEQYVTVLKADPNSESGKGSINVWMKVEKSNAIDLPSAIEHMKRKLRMGDGSVLLDDDVFIPDMDSLNVEHQYEPDEAVTPAMVEGETEVLGWYKNCFRNYPFWLASTVFIVLLLILVFFTALMVHHRRKYSRSLQFRHRILDNQYSQEHKGFVEGEVAIDGLNESSVILVSADDLEKKQPIA